MKTNRIELFSPLSSAECAARLAAAIETERSPMFSLAGLLGSKPMAGHVTETSLRLRKRPGYHNSFQSYLTATIRPVAGGTVISGKFTLHPFVRVFTVIWFGFGILFVALCVPSANVDSGDIRPFLLGGLGILVAGLAIVQFCKYLARDEPTFITDFLVAVLDGQVRSGPSTREEPAPAAE